MMSPLASEQIAPAASVSPEAGPPAEVFDQPRRSIDEHLARLAATAEVPESLRAAIEYSLLGGGKRLRPVMAWHCAIAAGVGGSADEQALGRASVPWGAAVELVHAFSLVHDDLPAMDDDDLRRGRPTLHIHAGEAMAILAGDAMSVLAFHALLAPMPDGPEGPESAARPPLADTPDPAVTTRLLAELTAGSLAMIGGQVYDTLGGLPAGLSDRETLELIHRNKTGALLRAAARGGAICGAACAGLSPDHADARLRAITSFADHLGLMFQVVDDLIDVEQSSTHAGKRTGKDAAAGKLTFPGLLGVEASRRTVAELRERALAALRESADQDIVTPGLEHLVEMMANRTH